MLSQNNHNEMNKEEIINKIVEKIKTHYQPERVILCGSYGWGDPTKDSAIDLLIDKKTNKNIDNEC